MKIRNREYKDVVGTSFFGQKIYATREQLEKILGNNHKETSDGKTTCEWKLSIDNIDCCIYDYKTGSDGYVYWHIGVRNKEDGEIIKNKIYEYTSKQQKDD